uniref:uncharacterized protein uimc1 isoform X1 n=1 Tax=Solea senegalensis TaxID=28829 RepID=UPI001CD8D4FD|nr:uncharacterized protein uimc1 isoform X1 [Solea senegalensis]XP_043898746.1 uncharacterized protein uimc1 isoform X1 [Solea senegalensis]XP_043898747.1 uncharacterized protein uimc1 isoform X1 [Solea senegalensis]
MTEEEMMKLAVRLSEQEASDTARRLQQEEEAVMKAIQESMVDQTSSQSRSLLTDGDTTVSLSSQRKCLRWSRRRTTTTNLNQELISTAKNRRKKKEGGVSMEGAEITQLTDDSPQLAHDSIGVAVDSLKVADDSLKVANDSPQVTDDSPQLADDSPQLADDSPLLADDSPLLADNSAQVSPLRNSPTFPASGCRVAVHVPRLSQNLLESCRTSGFVLFSQKSCSSSQITVQPKSPKFPRSPGETALCPNSPAFSETEPGNDGETQLSPEYLKSPTFSGNMQREMSSQQSQRQSPVRTTSCSLSPNSPVFPGSPRKTSEMDQEETHGQISSHAKDETTSHCLTQHSSTDPDGGICSNTSGHAQDVMESLRDKKAGEMELTSDMTLVWSDQDDDVITPTGYESPVFPEEWSVGQTRVNAADLNHRCPTGCPTGGPVKTGSDGSIVCQQQLSTTERELQPISSERAGPVGPTVHYYWGIPFCPRGLDPDSYTQVIITQMDVYTQTLKHSQRTLLRKAPWGPPILPPPQKSPSPESPAETAPEHNNVNARRRLRRRHKQQSDAVDTEEETEGQVDGDVCAETQMNNDDSDSTQDLTALTDAAAQLTPGRVDPPEVVMMVTDDSPQQEETDADYPSSEKMEGDADDVSPYVMNEKAELERAESERSTSPEPEAPVVFPQSSDTNVDCPMCQGSFSVTKIELHAAYCDGDVQVCLKPRRKRPRRGNRAETDETSGGRKQEKCYICHKVFPLRDYSRHTELCIHQCNTHTTGKLLSALEQTESRRSESRASGSTLHSHDVIDLRFDEDDRRGRSLLSVRSHRSRPPQKLQTTQSTSENTCN